MKRVLKHGFHLTRWTLCVLIILVTLLLLAGRLLTAYVADSTADAVARLSDVLGVPVSVESVETQWRGLGPQLSLRGLQLGEGEDLTTFATLSAKPDVLSSLKNWTLVWSRFEASGLQIDIDELPTGGWEFAGISFQGSQGGGSYLERTLLESGFVVVSDSQIHLTSANGSRINLRLHEFSLANALGFHRLKLDADFGDRQNRLQFIAELHGAATRFTQLDGLAHMKIEGGDIRGLYTFLKDKFWPDSQWQIPTAPSMAAEFWGALRADEDIHVQGNVAFNDMPANLVAQDAAELNGRTGLVAVYADQVLSADLVGPQLDVDGKQLQLPSLRLSRSLEQQQVVYGLRLPPIDVRELLAVGEQLGAINPKARAALDQLQPQGQLDYFQLRLPSRAPQDWTLRAHVQNAELASFKRAPAVRNLAAWLELDADSGVANIDAQNVEVLYPKVYDHWLVHNQLRGAVAWEIDKPGEFVYVYSDLLEVESAQGQVQGAFKADVPLTPDYPTGVDLTLMLGLRDSAAAHADMLIPSHLPEDLGNWLSRALVAGEVPRGAMLYRGSTRPGTEQHRTVQLRLQAQAGELAFLPDWPSVQELSAEVWVSNKRIWAQSPESNFLGLSLADSRVAIEPGTEPGDPLQLRIAGQVRGPANAALDVLRKTGLRSALGSGLDGLDLRGDLVGSLTLELPVTESLDRGDLDADIDIRLADNELRIAELGLALTDVRGRLTYDDRGLGSEDLQARVWDRPLSLAISEDFSDRVIRIDGEGVFAASSVIDWLDIGFLGSLEGETAIDGHLEISTQANSGTPHRFAFSTDMQDVTSGLPAPFAKSAGQRAPLSVRFEKDELLRTYLDWQLPLLAPDEDPRHFRLEMRSAADGRGSGAARMAYQAEFPEMQVGLVRGNIALPETDLVPWLEVFSGYDRVAEDADYGTVLGLQPQLQFELADLTIGETALGMVSAQLGYSEDVWNIDFDTDYASGTYHYYRQEDQLPLLSFKTLDINRYQAHLRTVEGHSPDTRPDPREFPEMRVDVQSVVLDEVDRGQWQAQLRPTETGLWIGKIEGGLASARLSQEAGESSIFWGVDKYGQYTEANLTFDYADIGDLFQLLAVPAPMSSSSGLVYASLHWQGAPFDLADSSLNGIMGVQAERGEFFTDSSNVNALMKTIGLFNVGAWTRRLRLDFADVTARGTHYDSLVGDFVLEENLVSTLTPVTVDLSSGSMLFDGEVDLDQELVDAKLVVTLPARQNMTWVAALVAGLPAAAGVWLASKVFDEELDNLSSVSYRVTGPMDDPRVEAEKMFESTITE